MDFNSIYKHKIEKYETSSISLNFHELIDQLQISECKEYNKAELQNLYLSSELPVPDGTELIVTCFNYTGLVKQIGDTSVRCLAGNIVYKEKPQCVTHGKSSVILKSLLS